MFSVKANGATIPVLGFGTWRLSGKKAEQMVQLALEIGYRHIDTAQMYDNEEAVGRGIRASSVPRSDIFLTTKLIRQNLEPRALSRSVHTSLEKLGTDYVDLLLIHWPNRSVPLSATLDAMNQLKQDGNVRHIGVSNFTIDLLEEAISVSEAPLVTNQVEYHPYLDQSALLRHLREAGSSLTAYSPLAKGRVIGDQTLAQIGERYDKTEAQVALRWLIQQEKVITIPKSSSEEHCRQNFNIFDFELTSEEMEDIANLAQPNGRIVSPGFMNFD